MSTDTESVVDAAATRLRTWGIQPTWVVLVAPLVGITIGEIALFYNQRSVTLWSHVATIVFCTLAPFVVTSERATLRALALVPLFRIINLGMPTFFQLTVYWFPVVYGPMIPALYLVSLSQDAVDPDVRWKRAGILMVPLALPLAVLLAEAEYRLISPNSLIPAWDPLQLAFITIVMVGFVGLAEELLFRGILQRTLQRRFGYWSGLLVTSAIFGLMHSGYGVPLEIAFAGVIGLVFGLVYDWTDSLALVTVIHGALNVFLFAIIPMQGSFIPV